MTGYAKCSGYRWRLQRRGRVRAESAQQARRGQEKARTTLSAGDTRPWISQLRFSVTAKTEHASSK